jgi:hypothetical protein
MLYEILPRGLLYQASGSLMSLKSQGPQLKVPPEGNVLRTFTSWNNSLTLAGFEPTNLGSQRKQAYYPETIETDNLSVTDKMYHS